MPNFLVFSIKLLICSSFLNLLTPNLLKSIRECIAKKVISNQIKCDQYINNFLKASNSAVSEIYSTLKLDYVPEPQSGIILGVNSGILRLSSSSAFLNHTLATRARLNLITIDGNHCWWPSSSTTNEFIQASSSFPVLIQAINTVGCKFSDARLIKFKLLYTLDGENWFAYNNGEELIGNFDRTNISRNVLSPFLAKSLRIYPISWNSNVGTRLEVEISKISYDPLPPRKPDQVWIAALNSGFNALSSSMYSPDYDLINSMLYFRSLRTSNAWCAGFNNTSQWISISSSIPVMWNQISIQGSSQSSFKGKVTKFSVSYTLDGIVWTDFNNKQTFIGSYDLLTPISIVFEPSFSALAVKVRVAAHTGTLCMRIEAFCSKISR